MHELNISPPLSLARFFLTQQLIYRSKIEKHSVSLDIFVPDTGIGRNLHLPRERTSWLFIRTHTLVFGSDFGSVARKQETFEDQDLIIIGVKNICIDQ